MDRRAWIEALVATAITGALLSLQATTPPISADTARDLLLARDCAGGLGCHGPITSFDGLVQGAGWIRLLALLRGLGPVAIHRLLIVADAASVGAMLLLARRTLTARAARIAAIAFGVAIGPVIGYPLLWNPAIAPLPVVAFAAALYAYAARRGAAPLLGAVIALACLIESHIGYVAYAPLLLVAVLALADRPWATLAATVAAIAGIELLVSREAMAVAVRVLSHAAAAVPVVILCAVACVVVVRRRPWVAALAPERRAALLTLAAVPYAFATALPLALVGHEVASRYFAPALAPGAIWIGARVARAPRWVVRVLAAVAALAAVAPTLVIRAAHRIIETPVSPAYDMGDAQRIAATLGRDGFAYADLRRGLRGPAAFDLLGALAAVWPDPFAPPARSDDVRVLWVRGTGAPPDFSALPSGDGDSILIGPIASWLQPERMQACVGDRCIALPRAAFDAVRPARSLCYPRLDAIDALARGQRGPLHLVQRIPVAISGTDPARVLQTFGDPADHLPAWRITRVDGVEHRGALPGSCVTLIAGSSRTGSVELVLDLDRASDRVFLVASYLETRPDEQSTRDALAPSPRCAP